jgi:integrase
MKEKAGSVSKYITKAGERLWRYRFDVGPVDGKRQVISKQGFETRGAAMTAMCDAIQAHRDGRAEPPPPPVKESLGDWVRTWLRDYGPHQCSPKTLERYGQLADYVLKATEGELAALAVAPLGELKHTVIEAALYALLRMPAKRKKHLSPKTIREIGSVISVALTEAFRLDKILVNPMLKVRLPKVEHADVRALTPDEVRRLRDAYRGDWTFAFVEISLATGSRRGELLALEWADVDWLAATVTICKSLEETAAGLRIKKPKNERPRKFKIGPTAVAALRFEQERQQQHRHLYGEDYKGDLVFSEPDGAYLVPHLVSQTIVRRLQKAGIKDASLHTLRHTHASHLLSKGVPLPAVSARLGHADVNITARIYSHMLPDDDDRAADAWETSIRGEETPGSETAVPVVEFPTTKAIQ